MGARERRHLGPVIRAKGGFLAAILGQPHRADQPLEHRAGNRHSQAQQAGPGHQRAEKEAGQQDQADPFHGRLASVA